MRFQCDTTSRTPIYRQLIDQVRRAVACGRVRVGDRLPSVRQLSRELVVNPNTIARAYRRLQDDRVLEPVRGTGLEVVTGAVERCRNDRLKLIRARLRQVLTEARQSRLEKRELRELVEKELSAVDRRGT